MKHLQALLQKGNLTPRERFLLLIQNDVERFKNNKEILTTADVAALEGWHAKTSAEAREWNSLNEGWKKIGRMDLEIEFSFNDAQTMHLQVKPVIMELLRYPMYREMHKMFVGINSVKKVTGAEAAEIIQKQRDAKLADGMDFEYAVYRWAFERLTPDDRARMIELYADVETDHQYLDQEEIIAHLLNGKEDLGVAAKKKLAALIAERAYNKFAKQYQLFHYFACIPLAEVARHFLEMKHIKIHGKLLAKNQEADDEDEVTHDDIHKATEQYAKEHDTTVEAILKEGFIHWYDTESWAYTPLVVSDDKELFSRWLVAKATARRELEACIKKGELTLRDRTPKETHKDKLYSKGLQDSETEAVRAEFELLEVSVQGGELDEKKAFETFSDKVLTGDSLYRFSGDFAFIKQFKERVDEYDPNLGLVYADDDPEQQGEHLDRELLLCPLNSKGEVGFFSIFGMSLMRLEALVNAMAFFEEIRKDGTLHLVFNNEQVEKVFRESRESFIAAYARLLAYKGLLERLSRVYEADLTFRVLSLLATLDGYIEDHNNALRAATLPLEAGKSKYRASESTKSISVVEDALLIDKDSIMPDATAIAEHESEFERILGKF